MSDTLNLSVSSRSLSASELEKLEATGNISRYDILPSGSSAVVVLYPSDAGIEDGWSESIHPIAPEDIELLMPPTDL